MYSFKFLYDKDSKITGVKTSLMGRGLLNTPELNKGSAFTPSERKQFRIVGRLPESVETLEEQVTHAYRQYQELATDLRRNIYLMSLADQNQTLFYKLVSEHLIDMMPIVYTPTVGEAVVKYSLELRRPRGIYISYPNKDCIDDILENRIDDTVDLILVTDGEGVLGIGDQGVGGMDISIGKLMVYTLCAGLNPNRYIPIQLDVGTNNEKLLNDPLYLGWRHKRISGAEYDDFIAAFVAAVKRKLPNVLLHWEDFGRANARKNLLTYREKICSFNDDMQGTGAVVLACVLSAMKGLNLDLSKQRIVVYGAGTAGGGIADQIRDAMHYAGLPVEKANAQFYLIDRHGLLIDDMDDLVFFQKPYAKSRDEVASWTVADQENISLFETIRAVKPTILIGCSGQTGAFTADVIAAMADVQPHPVILPLSNPTSLAEATPKDILLGTKGQALIATGSPFEPVSYNGKAYVVAQSNNAFIFPGLGLGTIVSKAQMITDGMIFAACDTLSNLAPVREDVTAPLLPNLADVKKVSEAIAIAVAKQAIKEGVSELSGEEDIVTLVKKRMWSPSYHKYTLVNQESLDG